MTVNAIVFSDDAVLIEYLEEGGGPFPVSSQVTVPYREAQQFAQLSQDLQELIQDAETLLDSVMLARMTEDRRPIQEMGR